MKNPQPITSDEKQRPRTPRPAWQYFLLGGGIALVGAICLASLALLIFPGVRAPLLAELRPASPAAACQGPSLTLGQTSFPIQELARAADGSLPFPPDSQGIAYRVQSVGPTTLLALGPSDEHLLLAAALKAGDALRLTYEDCSAELFAVTSVEATRWQAVETQEAPASGLMLFVQGDPGGAGFLVQGELAMTLAAPTAPPTQPAQAAASAPPEVVEVLPSFPPPDCGTAKLTIGDLEFTIQPMAAPADGSLPIPDAPGVAYWLEGTESHPVFALSPTAENLALADALKSGEAINIVWSDCVYEEYLVSVVEIGQPGSPTTFASSEGETTIFVQNSQPEAGYVVHGERPKAQGEDIAEFLDIPRVDSEITLGEVSTGLFNRNITVHISILNTGAVPITLLAQYISLTPEGEPPMPPLSVEPGLPHEIKPGSSEAFAITFPRPSSGTVIFRVFTIEFDLEDW